MIAYTIKRILLMIPTLFGITLMTFFVMKLAPGDAVSLKLMAGGQGITAQAMAAEQARQEKKIPLPAWYESFAGSLPVFLEKPARAFGKNSVIYIRWMSGIVQLDFGDSEKDHRPVIARIREALPITLVLNIVTILIVYTVSIPLGIWSAVKATGIWEKVVMVKLFILYSIPTFWIATMMLTYLAGGDYLNLFPIGGFSSDGSEQFGTSHYLADVAWHLALPVTADVLGSFAFLTRFVRVNFLEIIHQDYIRTARAKGMREIWVIWKHGFRNALIPFITLAGMLLPALLGGSVIIERIFSIPGMGLLMFEAVLGRDTNVVMAISTISAFLTLVSLLLTDLLYAWADPRITFDEKE